MNNSWALVLAAGEGSRLRSLTTTRSGEAVPKQFCSLRGGPSLLQEALRRAELVAPRSQVCTIVAAHHRRWWEASLRALPSRNVIVQPENRGTALGLLLPLLHIAARDPQAHVVVLPSDHYVRDEAALARALRQLRAHAAADARHIYMLGAAPDAADPELGYIVPAARDERGVLRVGQFAEKPSLTLARALIDRGAVWNTFILAAAASTFIALFAQRYPELVMEMRGVVQHDLSSPIDALAAVELYARLPELDFSRDVLECAEASLRLIPAPACGWSDLGTPKRVATALRELAHEEHASHATADSSAHLNLAAQHARLQVAV